MSYAAAANVITQTGTDADLSGLTGVTGVTVTTLGGVTKYSLNSSTSMVVSGTLTIDPRINFLEILKDGDTTLRVSSTGVMTIGAILTYSQASMYTTGMAISMVGRSTQPYIANIKNDGVFNWYGATIDSAGGFRTIVGATTTIRDGVFVSRLTQSGTPQGNQIYFEAGTCDIIGLTKTVTGAMAFDNASIGIVGTTTITNLKKVYSTGSVSADYRAASPNASIPYVTVTEFSPIQQSICEPTTALAYLVDCGNIYAAAQNLRRRDAYGTVTEHGQIEAYKTCNGTVTYNGGALLGAKIWWKDIDNGARGITAATAWGSTYTADRIYTATSDASGLFTLNVMEAAWYTTNAAAGTLVSGVLPDRRLETGEFVTAKAFDYLYTPTGIKFKGDLLGASSVTSPQSLDTSITETTKTTVDAYTAIGTPQEFYDRAKSYLYDNFAGETATMVTRVGSKIFLGAYNLVVDATAGTVFAESGGTITIKETVFVGDVETTGTVTLLNGATIQGIVTSSAGSTDFISVTGLVGAYLGLTDNVGAMADYQAAVTGTYTYSVPAGSTGPWELCLRRQGYAPRSVTITLGGTTHAIDGTLVKRINFDGSDAYTGTTSSLVSVAFNSPSAGQCRIDIGDGQVSAQIVYNMVCDAFVTSAGVCFGLDNVFQVDPIGFELYYMSSNLKLRRKLVGDTGAGVQGVVSQGDLAPVDETNGYVRIYSAPNALAKQDVRDSLLLAPTIGASVIAGSTDATLTAVQAKTDQLTFTAGFVHADAKAVDADLTAAANLALQFNGTGLTGGVFPATQDQASNIVTTGSPVSQVADSLTVTVGVVASGTVVDTNTLNGVYQVLNDTAGTLDAYYETNIGSDGVPSSVLVNFYLIGNNDTITLYAYNWTTASWQQIAVPYNGKNALTDDEVVATLTSSHVGVGANIGRVRVRFYGVGLTAPQLGIDRLLFGYSIAYRSVGYEGGAVWVNTGSSNTGTSPYIDGVADNPVNSYANAKIVADAVGLARYNFHAGDVVTLDRSHAGDIFTGRNYTVNCNSQVPPSFSENCLMFGQTDDTVTHVLSTGIAGLVGLPLILETNAVILGSSIISIKLSNVVSSAIGVQIADCSGNDPLSMAGATIDFSTTAGTNHSVSSARWAGPMTFLNQTAGDTIYWHGEGSVTLDASCTGGTLRIAGAINIIDNTGGDVTIINDAQLTKSGIASEVESVLAAAHGAASWLSATGFATPTNVTDARDVVTTAISGLNDFDPAVDVVARVTLVDTTTTNSDMRGTDGAVTSLSGIATATNVTDAKNEVIAALPDAPLDSSGTQAAAAAAITAAALATHTDAVAIATGVGKASKLIPFNGII